MDRGAWWATGHGVTKSQIQLSDWAHMHTGIIAPGRNTGLGSCSLCSHGVNQLINACPCFVCYDWLPNTELTASSTVICAWWNLSHTRLSIMHSTAFLSLGTLQILRHHTWGPKHEFLNRKGISEVRKNVKSMTVRRPQKDAYLQCELKWPGRPLPCVTSAGPVCVRCLIFFLLCACPEMIWKHLEY